MKRWCAALALAACSAWAQATPWWTAYGEPALDQVMQAAPAADGAAQQERVQRWIVARVQQARIVLAEQLLQAARAEQALLMNAEPGPARDPALAAVGQRIEQTEGSLATLQRLRDHHLQALSAQTGIPAPELARALVSAGLRVLPQVDGTPRGPDAEAAALAALARETARLQQLQQARQLELKAQQTRERAGDGDPVTTLQTMQQLVLDTDRVAVSAGRLALAWSEWLPRGSAD